MKQFLSYSLLVIRLENTMYLLVLIYKYNIRKTWMSQNTVLSGDFSSRTLTEVSVKV